jgi:hypothetical protein
VERNGRCLRMLRFAHCNELRSLNTDHRQNNVAWQLELQTSTIRAFQKKTQKSTKSRILKSGSSHNGRLASKSCYSLGITRWGISLREDWCYNVQSRCLVRGRYNHASTHEEQFGVQVVCFKKQCRNGVTTRCCNVGQAIWRCGRMVKVTRQSMFPK